MKQSFSLFSICIAVCLAVVLWACPVMAEEVKQVAEGELEKAKEGITGQIYEKGDPPGLTVVPPTLQADPYEAPTVTPTDPRPEVVQARDHRCPEGYYCKTVHGGFLESCRLGSGNPDCNEVAINCRNGTYEGADYDKYCKD